MALSCSFEARLFSLWPTSAVHVSGVSHPMVLFSYFRVTKALESESGEAVQRSVSDRSLRWENIPFEKPTPWT